MPPIKEIVRLALFQNTLLNGAHWIWYIELPWEYWQYLFDKVRNEISNKIFLLELNKSKQKVYGKNLSREPGLNFDK